MRISDWSSDVCSSDLRLLRLAEVILVQFNDGERRLNAALDAVFEGFRQCHVVQKGGSQHFAFSPAAAFPITSCTRTIQQRMPSIKFQAEFAWRRPQSFGAIATCFYIASGGDRKSTRLNSSH